MKCTYPKYYKDFKCTAESCSDNCCIGWEIDIDEKSQEGFEDEQLLEALIEARTFMIALLQNRDYSVRMRLAAALRFAYNLQIALEDCFDEGDAEQLIETMAIYRENPDVFFGKSQQKNLDVGTLSELLEYFLSLEVLDENWPKGLELISSEIAEVAASVPEFTRAYPPHSLEYEHLAVYFVYRYMLEAVYNCDVLYCTKLMVVAIILFALLDTTSWRKNGDFLLEEQILIVKAFSKEIEYNTENLDKFREDSWTEKFLSTKSLLELLA